MKINYMFRPREKQHLEPVLIRDICRRYTILFMWCTIGQISTGVEYKA